MWETWVRFLEKAMATYSIILAWRIPWTEEPDRLQSMGSQSQTRLSDFTFLSRMPFTVSTVRPMLFQKGPYIPNS